MAYLDIHSHILPNVDDGAQNIQTSIELLRIMQSQGITHVAATPHFYPEKDSAEDFAERVNNGFAELQREVEANGLPQIFLGCEFRYFGGMGKNSAIKQFTINKTNYLLLELPYGKAITKSVLKDIVDMQEHLEIIPILAHIERYYGLAGYKKLLKLILSGYALGQINAAAVVSEKEGKICKKLLSGGYVSYLASDTHSPDKRPPMIKSALDVIAEKIGKSVADGLVIKSNKLLEEIEE